MKKHIKRKIAWVLALSMCASVMLIPVSAAESQKETVPDAQQLELALPGGTCGEMLEWKLESHILTISGTGCMDHYSLEDVQAPWKAYGDDITEVVIENGVETIGDYAFYGLTQLEKVEIPESIGSIGAYAFSGCDALEAFELPESVTDVAETAFAAVQPEGAQTTQDKVDGLVPESTDPEAAPADSAAPEQKGETTVVPETETAAEQEPEETPAQESAAPGNGAEQGQAPEETPAQEPAAAEPSAIPTPDETDPAESTPAETSDAEDSAQEEIATYSAEEEIALYSSDSISRGDWTYSVVDGRAYVKSYDGYASSVTIPTSVTLNGVNYKIRSVGEFAFAGNVYLRSVTIPSSVTRLERGAFKNCTNLSSVTINGDLGDADYDSKSDWADEYNSVFYNAGTSTDGMTVTFGSSVRRVPSYLFATGHSESSDVYAHVTKVVLSSSIVEIGPYAFHNCYGLTDVDFGKAPNLSLIGNHAFAGASLTNVSFSGAKGLKTIDNYAFDDTNIRTLSLPSNLATINAGAFANCTRLSSVTLPKSVVKLGNIAFKNCTNLSTITINGNLGDASSDSVSSWNDENYSIFYNAGTNTDGMTVTFGSSVRRVPSYLFATGHSESSDVYAHVTKIVLSSSIVEIGSYAFYNCYNLKSTTFSATRKLKTIDSYAFANTALSTLKVPGTVTAVNERAFLNCERLASITLPQSLTKLGNCAFKNCTGLKKLIINANLGDISYDSKSDWNDENYSVFYNAGTNTDGIYVAFGNHVNRIPAYLFATGHSKSENVYANVKSVYIPYTVHSIGDGAFYNCYNLKTLDFRGDRVAISDNAFTGVTAKAYYPKGSLSWKKSSWKNYGGKLTWQAKTAYLSTVKLTGTTCSKSSIKVRWEKTSKASAYSVYRRTANGSWSRIGGTTGTSYTDTTAKVGVTYYYTVRARSGGNISPRYNTTGVKGRRLKA